MAQILVPGYLRWDGTKYVLDQTVEIVGPTGPAGAPGSVGPQGDPGIGVGAAATGDLSGTFPGPIAVIGLTGITGLLNFAGATVNPTIGQAATSGGTGQPLTLRAQGAVSTGGDINIQSGTGSTAGLINFLVGNTTMAAIDTSGTLRIGPSALLSTTAAGNSLPTSGTTYLHGYNAAGNMHATLVSAGSTHRAGFEALNNASGATLAVGLGMYGAPTTHGTTQYAGHGVLEQFGAATSALVFTKRLGNGTSLGVTGRIYQSGAWGIGDATNNDTSSEAQINLTGPVLNIGAATGTFNSTANQMALFNIAGSAHLQGHADVRFDVGSTLAGYFDGNTNFRFGPSASTGTTIIGNAVPLTGVNYLYGYNASGSIFGTVVSGNTATRAGFEAVNNGSGTTLGVGIGIYGASTSHATAQYAGNGIVEQFGAATSAMIFTKRLGDGTGLAATGRIFQSGAWVIGDNAINDTSAEAQSGLTGPLLNVSPITGGTLTTTANQGLVYNNAGQLTLQGNTGVSLLSGTVNIASITSQKFVTSQGRRVKVTATTTSPYSVLATDEVVSIGTIAAPFTVTLPSSPTTGDTYLIKDANGSAAAFNITVQGNGNNIDATTNAVISTNYGSITVVYNGTKWIVV